MSRFGHTGRSWLRRCVINWEFASSIPDDAIGIFHGHSPSGRTKTLLSIQPNTEMSTRNISCGVKVTHAWA